MEKLLPTQVTPSERNSSAVNGSAEKKPVSTDGLLSGLMGVFNEYTGKMEYYDSTTTPPKRVHRLFR